MSRRLCGSLAPLGLLALLANPAAAQTAATTSPPAASPPAASPAGGNSSQPIQITATQGIEWRQADHEVIATGNAVAIRGDVTVDADQLIAHYRKKAIAPGAPAPAKPAATPAAPASAGPESALDGGDNEIYQLDAIGHVHIFTPTDNAYGDHAVYYLDDAVLILTGAHLKLTTQHDVIRAKNAIEYYSVKRIAVARGNASIVADDGRSIAADTIVGILNPATPPPASAPPTKPGTEPDMLDQAGKLQRVEAYGHVQINTPTEEATGDKGVYLPDKGLARLGGNVVIISGQNRLSGSDALMNTKTNVAQLLAGPGGQVAGTVVPNSTGTTQ
jgi:lipopolysaccharide export system protein LptA